MSNLVEFARAELSRAGLDAPDADYNGATAKAVMELVETFARQGHSGASGQLTLAVFNRVVQFKPLTAITAAPDEWTEVQSNLWQCRRDPELFSTDGGKTYYNVNHRSIVHHSFAPPA